MILLLILRIYLKEYQERAVKDRERYLNDLKTHLTQKQKGKTLFMIISLLKNDPPKKDISIKISALNTGLFSSPLSVSF